MLFFVFFSMAFDRCSINDYLLTYLESLAGFKGAASRREGEREGREREGRGGEWKGTKGAGREGKPRGEDEGG